jgi:hypothetical protein
VWKVAAVMARHKIHHALPSLRCPHCRGQARDLFYHSTYETRDGRRKLWQCALMWNMFESLACQRFANVPTIVNKVNNIYRRGLLRHEDFIPYLKYFQSRYLTGGHTNDRFEDLRFRRNDKKELVRSVLKGELDGVNNIVSALLLIVYRLRNNLFHGEKNPYKLNFQEYNFKVANQILAKFLNLLKR